MESGRKTKNILLKEMRHIWDKYDKQKESIPFIYMYGIRTFPVHSIKTILDIGANVGFYSVAFRFFQPRARIVAIEPDFDSYNFLVNNTKNLSIETYKMALGNGESVGKIAGRNSLSNAYSPNSNEKKCESLLLSDMIKKYNIDTNDLFIKIDTEGAEEAILNHNPSEEIIRKSLGTSMEIHHRCCNYKFINRINIVERIENRDRWIEWARGFSNTHNIYHCSERLTHLSILNKSITLNSNI